MTDSRLDQHLVIHDVCVLALAALFGVLAAGVSGSLGVGMATMGALLVFGVALLRVRPFLRTVNHVALIAKGVGR